MAFLFSLNILPIVSLGQNTGLIQQAEYPKQKINPNSQLESECFPFLSSGPARVVAPDLRVLREKMSHP